MADQDREERVVEQERRARATWSSRRPAVDRAPSGCCGTASGRGGPRAPCGRRHPGRTTGCPAARDRMNDRERSWPHVVGIRNGTADLAQPMTRAPSPKTNTAIATYGATMARNVCIAGDCPPAHAIPASTPTATRDNTILILPGLPSREPASAPRRGDPRQVLSSSTAPARLSSEYVLAVTSRLRISQILSRAAA